MSTSGRPELRIGDAEREAAVAALGEHFAAGRLTKDEYDERAAQAFSARTASALRPLFADLPGPQPFAEAPRAAWTGPGRSWPTGPSPLAPGTGAPRGAGDAGRRTGFRVPFLPVLLMLVGLAILLGAPWLVFIGLGVLWLTRPHRRGSMCGSRPRSQGWD